MPLPILQLPHIPSIRILELVRPIDLIAFLRCSKRCKRLVKFARISGTYSLDLNSENQEIKVVFSDGNFLLWDSKSPKRITFEAEFVSFPFRCRYMKNGACGCWEYFWVHCSLNRVLKFLTRWFPIATVDHLRADTKLTTKLAQLAEKYHISSCKQLTVYPKPHTDDRTIECTQYPYPLHRIDTEMACIQVSLSPPDDILLRRDRLTKLLTSRKLFLGNISWMFEDDFNSIDCEIGSLKPHTQTDLINGFLRHWLQSNNTKLKYLHIGMNYGFRYFLDYYPLVLDGLDARGWDGNSRGRYYPLDLTTPQLPLPNCAENDGVQFDLKDGKDIRRSDGVIATVLITESKDVYFFVW